MVNSIIKFHDNISFVVCMRAEARFVLCFFGNKFNYVFCPGKEQKV